MITIKSDFDIVVAMYIKIKEIGHNIGCHTIYCPDSCNECTCNTGKLLSEAKVMIEDSARYLHLLKRRLKNGKLANPGSKRRKYVNVQK